MKNRAGSPPTPTTPSTADGSFEELLARLEDIIHRIESGEVGLERSIAEYEQGVALVRKCRDILTKAEQKVEHLSAALMPLAGGAEAGAEEDS